MSLHAREVRERLKNKCDPQVSYCIEALAEQALVREQEFQLMAETIDKLIDNLTMMQIIAEGNQKVLDEMRKIRGDTDDTGPTV